MGFIYSSREWQGIDLILHGRTEIFMFIFRGKIDREKFIKIKVKAQTSASVIALPLVLLENDLLLLEFFIVIFVPELLR